MCPSIRLAAFIERAERQFAVVFALGVPPAFACCSDGRGFSRLGYGQCTVFWLRTFVFHDLEAMNRIFARTDVIYLTHLKIRNVVCRSSRTIERFSLHTTSCLLDLVFLVLQPRTTPLEQPFRNEGWHPMSILNCPV